MQKGPDKPGDSIVVTQVKEKGNAPRPGPQPKNQASEAAIVHRLRGSTVPRVSLGATDGAQVDLSELQGVSVIYAYPRTSPPDAAPIEGWDQIPGARGCTPQTKEFAAHYEEILAAGAARVFGLSTQDTNYQAEMKARLHVPFEILSDAELRLAQALDLPTFEAGGMVLLTRLTLILRDNVIEHVLYPVKAPAENPADVLAYLGSGSGT